MNLNNLKEVNGLSEALRITEKAILYYDASWNDSRCNGPHVISCHQQFMPDDKQISGFQHEVMPDNNLRAAFRVFYTKRKINILNRLQELGVTV